VRWRNACAEAIDDNRSMPMASEGSDTDSPALSVLCTAASARRSEYGGTAPSEYAAMAMPMQLRRADRSEAGDSSSTVTAATEMRMVVRHRTLAEIVAAIEEYFVKAADAGDGVSALLEASRAQLDRNFRQLKSK
jgi:hypothetical protein